MSSDTTDTTAPPEVTPEDRRLLMLELWGATLKGLLKRLEGDEAENLSASFFDVTVSFLRDSGISAETVTEAKDAMVDLTADLAAQIAEVQAEAAAPTVATTPAPVKTPEATAVTPLEQPFKVCASRS